MMHGLSLVLFAVLSVAMLTACSKGDNDYNPGVGESSSTGTSSATSAPVPTHAITLTFLGRYSAGVFAQSAAEIPVFDSASQRAFVVNSQQGVVDVLDMSAPAAPAKIGTIDANSVAPGAVVNSVAIHGGIIALAIEAARKTDDGFVGFYDAADLRKISHVGVGALPDMLIFTPDGNFVLVANEGEPSDDYRIDPEGSISVIDVRDLSKPVARRANFHAFNGKEAELRAQGVRIYGPGANASMDFEPEYIAVSADSTTAWAVLQENNALAKIDIASATVTDILPLGYKDHGLASNGLDVSDADGRVDVKAWPGVRGLYLPDAMAAYTRDGQTYLVTANEGDSRAWVTDEQAYFTGDASAGFVEDIRVKHLLHPEGFERRVAQDMPPHLRALATGALLNPDVFGYCGATAGDPGDCLKDSALGRLIVTWTLGYRTDAQGKPVLFNAQGMADPAGDRLMYDALYSFGARSFAIWNAAGELVWDSADQIERYLASDACRLGAKRTIPCAQFFNSNHEQGGSFDNRSDNKGPEPEGVVLGEMGADTFAFVGLERMGGVMVYNINNPHAPVFVDYLNTREDWTTDGPGSVLPTVGDLGPEGLAFVRATDSPNGVPLLIVGNEVSGTTSVYEIKPAVATQE